MKYFITPIFWLVITSFYFASFSRAFATADCDPPNSNGLFVKKFTNYAPRAGGINGRCGTSASGNDACQFFLEDHLAGKKPMTMGAVSQKGGTSILFGGKYRAIALEQKIGKQIYLYAGDRYAKSSNYKCKMDVVTRDVSSDLTSRVNVAAGYLTPVGRIKGQPAPYRKIERYPSATEQLIYAIGRCRTVKLCKINGQILKNDACASLGWYSAYICFEKEPACNPNPGACTSVFPK